MSGEKILERRFTLASQLSAILEQGGRLLDVGCGNGAQTQWFLQHFDLIVGLDVQIEQIKQAPVEASWVAATAECLPFPDNSFDAITSFEVLEHVVDPIQTMREFHRVLKKGRQAVISVPNKWWIFETHGADLPVLPWNRVPFFSWLPESWHDRWAKARIYSRKKFAHLIKEGGFNIFKIYYVTAPMDRARPRWVQYLLRHTIFRRDLTNFPFLSVNHIAILTKRVA